MARQKSLITKTRRNSIIDSAVNGRMPNSAFTANRNVVGKDQAKATDAGQYTSSARGRMSVDGHTAGGSTWTFTQKDDNGNKIRQSGRSQIATRRQRYYDIRVGLGLAGG